MIFLCNIEDVKKFIYDVRYYRDIQHITHIKNYPLVIIYDKYIKKYVSVCLRLIIETNNKNIYRIYPYNYIHQEYKKMSFFSFLSLYILLSNNYIDIILKDVYFIKQFNESVIEILQNLNRYKVCYNRREHIKKCEYNAHYIDMEMSDLIAELDD